jgi:PAS domain S-box-containing protein
MRVTAKGGSQSLIEKKLVIGVGVALAILVMIGTVEYKTIQTLVETDRWVAHTHAVLAELEAVFADMEAAESSGRGYVATGDYSFVRPRDVSISNAEAHLQALRRLSANDSRQQRDLDRLVPLAERKVAFMRQLIVVRRDQDLAAAIRLMRDGEGVRLMTKIRELIEAMEAEDKGSLEARLAASRASARKAGAVVALGTLLAVMFLLPASWLIRRNILRWQRAEGACSYLASIVESSDDAIIGKTLDGIIVSWNRGAEKIYGYGAPEMTGKSISMLFPPGEFGAPDLMERVRRGESVDHYETVRVRKDGKHIDVSVTLSPVWDEAGRVVAASVIARDITERKRAEAENLRLATAIEQAAEGVMITDLEPRIQYVNPAFTRMTGYSRAEALGQNPRLLKSDRHDVNFYKEFWATILAGKIWHGEMINRRQDGTLYPEEMTIAPVRDAGGTLTNFIAIKQDVTERKRAQEALSVSETRYRRLFETARDGILLLDPETATITDVNPFVLELLGYAREEILGKKLWDVGPFRDVAASQDAFRSLQADGYVRYEDLPLETKSGDHIDVEFVSNTYRSDGKEVIQCNIRDMTERKRARKALSASETRYRRLFEAAQDGILLVDPETATITDVNPFVVKLLGFAPEEILGRKLWEIGPFRDVAASQDAFRSLQADGYARYEDLPLETKSGDRKDVEFISNSYSEGDKSMIQCNIRDITNRKRQEDQIQASLREKEIFLKEIHHRVKNNLQVISSLLHLRSAGIQDEAVLEMFRESQTRVRTMALIHEKLYQSKDFAHIDFGEYIGSLVRDLFHSYRADPNAIAFALQTDEVVLGIDTAIPCALIVNELVSNCLKHAFPLGPPGSAGRRGAIAITLSVVGPTPLPGSAGVSPALGLMPRETIEERARHPRSQAENSKVRLVVRDDGVGFPPSLDFRHTRSLGLQLVNTLTEQVGGTVELRSNGGTEFEIEFTA